MSKPYRIRLNETVSLADSSTFSIEPVPLITQQHFSAIMEETLRELGWTPDEEGRMVMQIAEGERWIYHPEKMQIVTDVQETKEIREHLESWSKDELDQDAQRIKEQRITQAQRELTQRLEAQRDERRQRFEGIVAQATGRAIKEAAKDLGDIQDIHEERGEDGRYALTITIHERD